MTDVFVQSKKDKLKLIEVLRKTEMPYRVKVTKGGRRSTQQNRYLWGVVYETILDHGFREMGYRPKELHEFFLGEHYGWEEIDVFGRKKVRPMEGSSDKSKLEFVDHVAFIQEKMAEQGIYIPDPDEELTKTG